MSSPQPEAQAQGRPDVALWTGLLGGPVAWLVHFQAVYALAMPACAAGDGLALQLVTALCVAASGGAAWLAWRNWRVVRGWPSSSDAGAEARVRLMAVVGVMAGALFTLI